jgi:hypothetical protein
MQHSNSYMTESMYPYTLQVQEGISINSKELGRLATLLIRLISILREEGVPKNNFDKTAVRVARKLDKELEIWDLYRRRDEEEYRDLSLELSNAIDNRKMLHIKRKLGNIGDEELSLKLSVADWGIEDLKLKKLRIEHSVNALNNLRSLFAYEDIEELYTVSKNNYEILREISLGSEITEFLIMVLDKLSKAVTSTNPSTL